MSKNTKLNQSGFTIVELLIVIVVIGILATVSIIAYNGITQKANNTAIISAANNSIKLIEAYIAQYGEYPRTSTGNYVVCITNQCAGSSGGLTFDTSLNNNLARVGTPPQGVPGSGDNRKGILYLYTPDQFINDESQPVMIGYWLEGQNKSCGLPSVLYSTALSTSLSTTGYTDGNHSGSGKTLCRVSVPGPAHS